MGQRLDGKVAIVTGGGSGIGRAVAEGYHREGAKVVVADVSGQEKLVAEGLGEGALPVSVDVSLRDQVEALISRTIERFGALHVVTNCAGIVGEVGVTGNCTDENWDRIMSVNLRGVFLVIRAALPHLVASGGGSIVNISSAQALVAFPQTPAYAASKGGVVSLTRVVAAEYASAGVRVNTICPGLIDTPMMREVDGIAPGALDPVIAMTPLNRLGQPEEIANLALFLASDEASYLTGGILSADGGYTAM